MYHEILVPCTHAQKEMTCSNTSLHPSEQFYMLKNTSRSVLIVWELIELTESCHLLKKRSESALEVRRCTTKFSYLAHMRRRRSPVQMQVYIPYRTVHWDVNLYLNRSSPSAHVCKVREFRGTSAHFQSTSERFLSRWHDSVNSISSHTMSTLLEVFLAYRTVHWDVNLHLNRWSPSAHVCKVREFRGTSAHFQSTFRALFKQVTWLC